MKKLGVVIWGIIILCFVSDVSAEKRLSIAVQYGGLMDSGIADNSFEKGIGVLGELGLVLPSGWEWVVFGTSVYWSENKVGKSTTKAQFYVPYYTDIRRSKKFGSFEPFLSIGTGWTRMHFDETDGSDNQWFISAGVGSYFRLGDRMALQVMIKPYRVFANSLENEWGLETHAGIGFVW